MKMKSLYTFYYLNIDETNGPSGVNLWGSFPNSQINFCWQPESSKPRDSKRRSNLDRSGSVFQSFISFCSSILLFCKLFILPLLNFVLKPIEGKRKDTGTPIKRSAIKKVKKYCIVKGLNLAFIINCCYILSLKMDLSVFCITWC